MFDGLGFLLLQEIFFCRVLDIRVAQIVEADTLGTDSFQYLVMGMPEGIRMILVTNRHTDLNRYG